MNERMRKTEDKARELKNQINEMNTFTLNYKKKMRHLHLDLI